MSGRRCLSRKRNLIGRIVGCGILGGGERKRRDWMWGAMGGSGWGNGGCSNVGWGGRRCLGMGVGMGVVGRRGDGKHFVGEGSRLVGTAAVGEGMLVVGEGMAVAVVEADTPVRKKAAAVLKGAFAAFAADYTAGTVGEGCHVSDLEGTGVVVEDKDVVDDVVVVQRAFVPGVLMWRREALRRMVVETSMAAGGEMVGRERWGRR